MNATEATKPSVYRQCGLRMRAEMELHLPDSPGDGWDVDVRWGPDIDDTHEPPPGEVLAIYEAGGTGDEIHAHAWLENDGRPLEGVDSFSAYQRPTTEAPE